MTPIKANNTSWLKGLWPFDKKVSNPAPELPLEEKQSLTHTVLAMHGLGRPQWTNTTYESLAVEGYMRNAVAYRCIRMISEAVASVPLLVESEGRRNPDHPLAKLLERPNPDMSGFEFREHIVSQLQTAGNAYVEWAGLGGSDQAELWPLRADRMKIVPGPKGWPEAYDYTIGVKSVRIPKCDNGFCRVLHLKLPHPLDDWYGFSPIEAAAFSIDVHNASGAWNKALLDNAARPSGALIYGNGERLGDEQFARLKEELQSAYSGRANAGRPLLLEGGLDWKPMALTPAEMDFIQGKYAAARDIALCFGVPSQLLGLPGDNSYANYKEANLAFWRQSVLPLVQRLLEGFNLWLGPRFKDVIIKPDLEAVPALGAERDSLWGRLQGADFLNQAEKRLMAGLSPKPFESAELNHDV